MRHVHCRGLSDALDTIEWKNASIGHAEFSYSQELPIPKRYPKFKIQAAFCDANTVGSLLDIVINDT